MTAYAGDNVTLIGRCLRHTIISTFPGADEKHKVDAVFAAAPPWLIWFTFADYTAKLLDLRLPDLSSVTGFARSKAAFDRLWDLPEGPFEQRPWPDGPDNEPLARTDLSLLGPPVLPENQMTCRERKRAQATYLRHPIDHTGEWPRLFSIEYLNADFATRNSLMAKGTRCLNKCYHDNSLATFATFSADSLNTSPISSSAVKD